MQPNMSRHTRTQRMWAWTIIRLFLFAAFIWFVVKLNRADPPQIGIVTKPPQTVPLLDESAIPEPDIPSVTSVFLQYIPHTHASTVQNLLMRYALKHNLLTALPRKDYLFFCLPVTFIGVCPVNRDYAPFDMMVHYLRYNSKEISGAMFKSTQRILVLRDPVKLIQAAFYEANWGDKLNVNTLTDFVNSYGDHSGKYDEGHNIPYRNIQFYALGAELSPTNFRGTVEDVVDMVMRDFHIVLIQERFLESLVLLRATLNWSYEDIATLVYDTDPEGSDNDELTLHIKNTITLYNAADKMLYDVTYKRLSDELRSLGTLKVNQEMEILKTIVNKKRSECLDGLQPGVRRTELKLSESSKRNVYCHYAVATERELTDLLKEKDIRKAKTSPINKTNT